MAKKNKKKGLKKLTEGLRKIFQNARDKINSFIEHPQNLVASAGLLPLKPFQPIMKKQLRKIGKPEGKNLAETSYNFVRYVMKKELFEEWQYDNFKNASFTDTIEDIENIEKNGDYENAIPPEVILLIIEMIPAIISLCQQLKKNDPDLDPNNETPDIPDGITLDPTAAAILLPYSENMKEYLTMRGETYSNDIIENALKIYKLLYPSQVNYWEYALGQNMVNFWNNNKDKILSAIGALFVTIGSDPANDPISQSIGQTYSTTSTAIKEEAKKQTMLKTYVPLAIIAIILLILLLSKKK